VHASRVGVVSQRDVGRDPLARADALRQTRHQDVDVVLVDELDDHAVLVEALTVAASGTLVLGSVRARTATEAIADAVQGFPLDRRPWGQRQLGDNLRAVVCQAWRPEGDGRRRVVAAEVLHMTEEIGRAVRDGDLATIGTAAP